MSQIKSPLSRARTWLEAHFGNEAAHRRHAKAAPIDRTLWQTVCQQTPLLAGLGVSEQDKLAEYAAAFITERPFYHATGFELTDQRTVLIAALACLPVLHLNLDWLAGIRSVVVYPDAFFGRHEYMDDAGIMHELEDWRAGEAWENGTLVLSWADVVRPSHPYGGQVIIHEIAHFIDGVNGAENGFPPLGKHIEPRHWTAVFEQAFARLSAQIHSQQPLLIDPYAATNPAEFFAVLSETFFTEPERVAEFDRELFALLSAFYFPPHRAMHA